MGNSQIPGSMDHLLLSSIFFFIYVVGEIVQELRTLTGLPEDQGLIPRIHMVVHKHLYYNCRESTTL